MKTICLIFLLSSSLCCFGEDKELKKDNNYSNIEVSKCVDPKCDNTNNKDDTKKYEELKVDDYNNKDNKKDNNNDNNNENNNDNNKNDNKDDKNDNQRENYFDDVYEYVGNPDFDAEIERPCQVYDLNCIRRYFAKHSRCKISRGPLPESVDRSQYTLYFTNTNMSTTLLNVRLGGFKKTRIEEFYINKKTNKMVFSIQMRDLSAWIPTVYFQFYRNGQEPIVTVTESASIYFTIAFTAVIPITPKDGIQLNKAEITPFVDELPAFYIGPEVASVPDPTVIQSLTQFYADLPTDAQELMLTESQFYPPLYIQYNICDFGLKLN